MATPDDVLMVVVRQLTLVLELGPHSAAWPRLALSRPRSTCWPTREPRRRRRSRGHPRTRSLGCWAPRERSPSVWLTCPTAVLPPLEMAEPGPGLAATQGCPLILRDRVVALVFHRSARSPDVDTRAAHATGAFSLLRAPVRRYRVLPRRQGSQGSRASASPCDPGS